MKDGTPFSLKPNGNLTETFPFSIKQKKHITFGFASQEGCDEIKKGFESIAASETFGRGVKGIK